MADKISTVSSALDTLNVKLGGTAGDIPADATKVDALKKVYETLGGTPADVADLSTTYELVEKIAEVAEGGGGGDFSTAEVTVIGDMGNVFGAWATLNEGTYISLPYALLGPEVSPVSIILYKHSAYIEPDANTDIEIAAYEGDIRPVGRGFLITGNCSITLREPQ